MGITSTGNGKAPSVSTSLLSSMMQMNLPRCGGDDLFPCERASAAFDQHPEAVRLVGPVDIELEIADGIELDLLDARRLQPLGSLARARDGACDLYFPAAQHIDELSHGGARADTEHHAVLDVGHRGLRGAAFLFSWREHFLSPKTTVPAYAAQLIIFEGLLFLSGLFLSCLLLRLLCFRCHDRNSVIGLVRGPSIYTNN